MRIVTRVARPILKAIGTLIARSTAKTRIRTKILSNPIINPCSFFQVNLKFLALQNFGAENENCKSAL